ncbi:MAG: hypothetical protein ABI903_07465 [Actinomycetota bacterium]
MALWRPSSRIANVALLGLLALDVALVGSALKSTHTSGIDTSPVSTAAASVSSAGASGSTSLPTSLSGSANAPLETMLVALDDQQAWRVAAGSCSDGGATLGTTVDGGKTWAKVSTNLKRIVRVKPDNNRAAFIVGADASCAALLMSTSNGGDTWAKGGGLGRAWFRDPQDSLVVRAPGSASSRPCGKETVLDLAVLTAAGSARVLCADGLVRSTTDNGSVWTDAGKVDGAVALAVPSAGQAETYVARLGAPECAGVQILRVRQLLETSCIQRSVPVGPGQIAMSLVKGGGWLALGDTTMRSTDDLVTWQVA